MSRRRTWEEKKPHLFPVAGLCRSAVKNRRSPVRIRARCWQCFWELGLHKYINYLMEGCPAAATAEQTPGRGVLEKEANGCVQHGVSPELNL